MILQAWFAVVIGLFLFARTTPALAAASGGQGLLQKLIEGARQEGELNLTITIAAGDKGAREMIEAFKRRFGLAIKINAFTAGQESQEFNKAVAETKGGIPPTFDLMQGNPTVVLDLLRAGGIEPIENWETLLAEIAPEAYKVRDKVSPSGVAGHALTVSTRIAALVYNPKLISERDLPKTWKEMGNPKYSGAFSVPPWTTVTLTGLIKYSKDELLEIARSWGRNKRQILTYAAGVQRLLLGDLKFLESTESQYFEQKARDPNAPLDLTYFEDLTALHESFNIVRKGTRHPNAAKLYALWATGAEAYSVYEKFELTANLVLGTGSITQQSLKNQKERNIKPVSWFDNSQNLEKFLWLDTKEGQAYAQAIARAQREGK